MERMILAGMRLDERFDYKMDELEALAKAVGGEVLGRVEQRGVRVDPATFLGSGKVEEIAELAENMEAETALFLHELTGSQIRNLENRLQKKVLDRTMLILDIFAQRATTNEGKLQVHLAQLQYRLPRLIGYGNLLSREGGGIGTRGPGEPKLETDRRHLMREIDQVRRQLKTVEKNRELLRSNRRESPLPIVSLLGYTNAGKSTLMNAMLRISGNEKEVFVKDMLFATLETRLRRCQFPRGGPFLLTDTVGLVSDLPTELVESFSSTLEEAKEADLILHVVDLSSPEPDIQIATTKRLMKDLGLDRTPVLQVFNKVDKTGPTETMLYSRGENSIAISAKEKSDILRLLEKMQSMIGGYRRCTFLFPYQNTDDLSKIMEIYPVDSIEHTAEGSVIELVADRYLQQRYKAYIKECHDDF